MNSSPDNPAVALDEVSKLYGRFAALRMVSGEFAAGRLYLILGENGAGKSTLLRVIAGLIEPSHGKLTILGSSDRNAVKPQLGYMAHASMLYDELSGRENLAYFAELYGIRDRAICDQAIRTVGLDPALERRVGQYSQGMRQRLSLARAILNDPRILLLDEPFSNVDVGSAQGDDALARFNARFRQDHLSGHTSTGVAGRRCRRERLHVVRTRDRTRRSAHVVEREAQR